MSDDETDKPGEAAKPTEVAKPNEAGKASDADKASGERRTKLRKAGVAVGIGSAAIVAALLYASNVKKTPKK